MHFGRGEPTQQLDLPLPPDAPRTKAFLDVGWNGAGKIFAGCPLWNVKDWVGAFYPEGTKAEEFLTAYAKKIGATEVNSTFYHQVSPDQIRRWVSRVTPDFRFCPKVFRGISEDPASPDLKALIRGTAESFEAFGLTYGLGFIQFPEAFSYQHGSLLRRFLEAWPKSLPLAVELRHASWFREHALKDEVINLLYRAGAATVITDTPGRRDVLHTSLTQTKVLVRFLGLEDEASDLTRSDTWAERLSDWAARGLDQLYFFAHQPTEELIPQTLNLFLKCLRRRGHFEPAPWRESKRGSLKSQGAVSSP